MPRSYAIVNSTAADKDFDKIKAAHADLLTGMALQADKVSAYKQQKATELQAQQTMQAQMQKEKLAADTAQKKDALTFAQKQAELDIKKAALTAI